MQHWQKLKPPVYADGEAPVFQAGFKLESCKNVNGDIKYIVCNADEGDPGSFSDRYVLEERPYALLIGMIIAGYVVGSNYGVLYIRAEYPDSVRIVQEAVDHLEAEGLTGQDICGSGLITNSKL